VRGLATDATVATDFLMNLRVRRIRREKIITLGGEMLKSAACLFPFLAGRANHP
jgi:hypothetical protein